MSALANTTVPRDALEALCRSWRVRELALFGSAVRDDFGPASDVDVLVSFDADAPWSLWDLITMRDELSELFGPPVGLLVEAEPLETFGWPVRFPCQASRAAPTASAAGRVVPLPDIPSDQNAGHRMSAIVDPILRQSHAPYQEKA